MDEQINSNSDKLLSLQNSLKNITAIQLYDANVIKHLDPGGFLRKIISEFTQTDIDIHIKGGTNEIKWFKFNNTYYAALTPFCILLINNSPLYIHVYQYSEISTIQNGSTSQYRNSKTVSLKITNENGNMIISDELLSNPAGELLNEFKEKITNNAIAKVVTEILRCTEKPCLKDILADIKRDKCLAFLQKPEPEINNKFKLEFVNTDLAIEKPIQNAFQEYVNQLNELNKSKNHLDYLTKRYEAQKFIKDEIACTDTNSRINDCNTLIETQIKQSMLPDLYRKLTVSDNKEQNKYYSTITYIEKEFSELIKPIATYKRSEDDFFKGLNVPAICLAPYKALLFFHYFLVLIENRQGKDCYTLQVFSYKSLAVKSDYSIVHLKFREPLPIGADVADAQWQHQNIDGSPDMRYRNNLVKYLYYKPFVAFKLDTLSKVVIYNAKQKNDVIANAINSYKKILDYGRAKKIVDSIIQNAETPDLNNIALELYNLDPNDTDDDYSLIETTKITTKKRIQNNRISESAPEKIVSDKNLRQTVQVKQPKPIMESQPKPIKEMRLVRSVNTKHTSCKMAEIFEPNFDTFVAFDIEHTGTFGAANGDTESEITEIGAVKVEHGVVTEKFDSLCNPGRKIVPSIARLTHITDKMVAEQPSVSEVIEKFNNFVGDYILIGHNIKACDIPHITRAADRAGVIFNNNFLDTRILANKFKDQQGWENIKLTTLTSYFKIQQSEAHRAWCDAEANAYVYLKLKELYKRQNSRVGSKINVEVFFFTPQHLFQNQPFKLSTFGAPKLNSTDSEAVL